MGATTRRLSAPAAEVPTIEEWEQHLKKKGPEGRWEGEKIRVGPETEIPPERKGFMTVQGARCGVGGGTKGNDAHTDGEGDEATQSHGGGEETLPAVEAVMGRGRGCKK